MSLNFLRAVFIVISLLVVTNLFSKQSEDWNDPTTYGFHRITNIHFEFDPYEGQYIDQYWFFFNDMVWHFDWYLYTTNSLAIRIGDLVKVNYGTESNPEYEMILYSIDLKPVSKIIGIPEDDKTIKAIEVTLF